MGHFAKVVNGVVTNVISADPTFFTNGKFIDTSPGTWLQTSYNTRGNINYLPNSTTPSGNVAIRGNFAGIGHKYDSVHDVFYSQSPYPSWILNTSTWQWAAPVAYPADGKMYVWDETTKTWILGV